MKKRHWLSSILLSTAVACNGFLMIAATIPVEVANDDSTRSYQTCDDPIRDPDGCLPS